MTKHLKKTHAAWPPVLVLIGLIDLWVLMALLLRGTDISLLHPKGLIAHQEFKLIVLTVAVLMAIAIPSVFLFYFFAWKYRETNEKATYDPAARHGKFFVFSIWAIPSIVMIVMSCIMWTSTHRLDPHTPIASSVKPLTIQVIALRWKWLFIYPAQGIASVNYALIPTGTPVRFELTADETPMSSFWVPHLAGQLYAMTGHVNTLNLQADTPGDFPGASAEINGAGFAGMKFMVRADTDKAFDEWSHSVQQSEARLDAATYASLVQPSEDNPSAFYADPDASLYDTVVMKYAGSHGHDMTGMEHE